MNKKIYIGAAWPYANNSLHLGHVAALVGADILARYHRLAGNDVLYVSGSDCHGTPITVEATKLGVEPADIALKYHKEFVSSMVEGLDFSYDLYTTTMTENHTKVVQDLFTKLYEKGLIYKKFEDLPYCEKCDRFLPDRFIEGTCPYCDYTSARGDQCDNCGKMIDPKELKESKCKICASAPTWKPSEHFYLKLTAFQEFLEKWVDESDGWRTNATGFAKKLLKEGLHDRAITRDTLWGIDIPLTGYETKRIYVWFEAVSGYLSASKEWAQNQNQPELWREWWENPEAVHYYVHGKDNIPFHAIIWPSILHGYGDLHLPDRIISSEYLTLERKQFSKSRNWAVWLPDFVRDFDSDTLRYFLVAAGPETSDADFSWKDYQQRVNSELIGTFGNFINRNISIIGKNFPEGVRFPEKLDELQTEFIESAKKCFVSTGEEIASGHFRAALREIFALLEQGNRFVNQTEPWKTVKENRDKAEGDLAVAAQVIRCLSILIEPFLPKSSKRILEQLTEKVELKWEYPEPLANFVPASPLPLYRRIEDSEIEVQISLLGK
jgi:methionyl-tRNA synthetase